MALAANVIFIDGHLITLNDVNPRAQSFAIRAGRFVAVGATGEILATAGPETRRVNLGGRTVVPGVCDSHLHLLWYGLQLSRQVELVGCASVDEVLSRLSQHAANTGGWIQGHGFDQDKLRERRFPTRAELDRVSRDRPILISRICGHAVVVNSAALALVDRAERDAGDADAGLYTENHVTPFYRRVPPPSEEEMEEAALAGMRVA